MSKQKLTIGMIHQNDSEWAVLALEAAEPIAEEVIIIDGGSDPRHLERLDEFIDGREKFKVIHKHYSGCNGLQYNEILKYATGDWILILDADEVIDDNAHLIREYMNKEKKIYSIRMNHCIENLAKIDATHNGQPQFDPKFDHYVVNRLFKNKPGIHWQPREHSTIQGFTEEEHGMIDDVIIWHYGKAKAMMDLKNKYDMNVERSKSHNREFLDWWYKSNLTGTYPVKLVKIAEHPSVVKREFYIK